LPLGGRPRARYRPPRRSRKPARPPIRRSIQTAAPGTANKALRLLVTEGLAELSPGMGFYVKASAQ